MSVCWPASTISIRLTVFTEWTLWRVWDELAPALVALLARATLRGTKGNMVCPLYASASVPVRCRSDVVHEAKSVEAVVGFDSRSRPTYLRTSAPGPPGRRCFEPFSRSLAAHSHYRRTLKFRTSSCSNMHIPRVCLLRSHLRTDY